MDTTRKLELTMWTMAPHGLKVMLSDNYFIDHGLKKDKTADIHFNIESLGYNQTAFITDDFLNRKITRTSYFRYLLPELHSFDKLTEAVLDGGLIPIVELAKIANVFIKNYLVENKSVTTQHLVGYKVFEYNTKHKSFNHTHYNDYGQTLQIYYISNQLELFEKLKEWNFNIYDLPKESYIEKSTVK